MNDKLKKIIFDKLYQDLKNVEIIPFNDSIWFIDRENKYWYFEYKKPGTLFWRYGFFDSYFSLFSLERDDCKQVMSEWVEEVLNCKVNLSQYSIFCPITGVEEVLNCKVNLSAAQTWDLAKRVEKVLNCKVNISNRWEWPQNTWVEEVLKHKVKTTFSCQGILDNWVEDVLNCKVNTTLMDVTTETWQVEEVLNQNK